MGKGTLICGVGIFKNHYIRFPLWCLFMILWFTADSKYSFIWTHFRTLGWTQLRKAALTNFNKFRKSAKNREYPILSWICMYGVHDFRKRASFVLWDCVRVRCEQLILLNFIWRYSEAVHSWLRELLKVLTYCTLRKKNRLLAFTPVSFNANCHLWTNVPSEDCHILEYERSLE